MIVAANRDYVSIGALAAHLQRPVRRIEQVAQVLDIEPAMRLNGIAYFDGGQVKRIMQVIVAYEAKCPLQQRENLS